MKIAYTGVNLPEGKTKYQDPIVIALSEKFEPKKISPYFFEFLLVFLGMRLHFPVTLLFLYLGIQLLQLLSLLHVSLYSNHYACNSSKDE